LIVAKDEKVNHDWTLTASLQALIANCNRTKNAPPYDVYHFHPYLKRPPRVPTADELVALFGGKNVKRSN
jgi:hypothetical protein